MALAVAAKIGVAKAHKKGIGIVLGFLYYNPSAAAETASAAAAASPLSSFAKNMS